LKAECTGLGWREISNDHRGNQCVNRVFEVAELGDDYRQTSSDRRPERHLNPVREHWQIHVVRSERWTS
jgi:hypothetical protein